MNTRSPLTKRIEIHFDAYADRKVIAYIEMHPSKMKYIKELIYKDFRRYERAKRKGRAKAL